MLKLAYVVLGIAVLVGVLLLAGVSMPAPTSAPASAEASPTRCRCAGPPGFPAPGRAVRTIWRSQPAR